jgi:hypothetical protein
MAIVAGVRGMIVLPDDWNASTYYLNGANEFCYYSTNTITGREWLDVLEPAGAVFMPAAGARFQFTGYDGLYFDWFNNEDAIDAGMWLTASHYEPFYICGSYWTSSQFLDGYPVGVSNAVALKFFTDDTNTMGRLRCKGYAVRLISDD